MQITNALHQLHKAGIAHRDIKLENIMLTSDFQIKLIDLGYGLPLDGRKGTGYMKTRCGTYMYMSPETLDRNIYYQGQDSDCFALGVSLLIARLNDYPWVRPDIQTDAHYKALAGSHGVNSEKFWDLYRNLNISEDFMNLIESMLAVDPSSRPTIVDVIGHAWFRGKVDTKEEFRQKCEVYF